MDISDVFPDWSLSQKYIPKGIHNIKDRNQLRLVTNEPLFWEILLYLFDCQPFGNKTQIILDSFVSAKHSEKHYLIRVDRPSLF